MPSASVGGKQRHFLFFFFSFFFFFLVCFRSTSFSETKEKRGKKIYELVVTAHCLKLRIITILSPFVPTGYQRLWDLGKLQSLFFRKKKKQKKSFFVRDLYRPLPYKKIFFLWQLFFFFFFFLILLHAKFMKKKF